MPIRTLVLALLAGVSLAQAAPPKSPHKAAAAKTEQPPETIDVDAMARSKDVGGPEAESSQNSAPDESGAPGNGESGRENPPPSGAASPASDESAAETAPQNRDAPASASDADASGVTTTSPTPVEATTPEPQTPADSGKTHGAPVAGADSQAISIAAACESRATSLLDNVEKSAFDAATADFDAPMRSALPPPKLKEAWDSLARFGKFNARGQSHLGTAEGYTLVMIPLIFDKANLVAQIACGSDGRVAGFHVTPAPKPQF